MNNEMIMAMLKASEEDRQLALQILDSTHYRHWTLDHHEFSRLRVDYHIKNVRAADRDDPMHTTWRLWNRLSLGYYSFIRKHGTYGDRTAYANAVRGRR